MDFCKINGIVYDVVVTEIEESFSILYSENTGRTMTRGARMSLDPLGTFFTHTVNFRRSKDNFKAFDDLLDFVSTPRYDGVPVEIVHNQTVLKYDAYISNGSRKLKRIDKNKNNVYWNEMVLNFIPMEAQVKV